MKSIFSIAYCFISATNLMAWDLGAKALVQENITNNVYLTNSNLIRDKYNTLGGFVQLKNDFLKFKLKAKTDKYKIEKINDNYSADFSAQYKEPKKWDFTFGIFKQVYNGTTLTSTDTSSDNSGGRFSGTLLQEYDKETSGYFTLNVSSKKYPKISNRLDKSISATYGIELLPSSQIQINPEFSIQNINSSNAYYTNLSYGPYVVISFIPNDDWEFFVDGSIVRSGYTDRILSATLKKKTVTNKEYQELINAEIGAIYNFGKYFTLQAKYAKAKNNSNNNTDNTSNTNTSAANYKANVLTFDFKVPLH